MTGDILEPLDPEKVPGLLDDPLAAVLLKRCRQARIRGVWVKGGRFYDEPDRE